MSVLEVIEATMKLAKQYEQGLLTAEDYKKSLWIVILAARTK